MLELVQIEPLLSKYFASNIFSVLEPVGTDRTYFVKIFGLQYFLNDPGFDYFPNKPSDMSSSQKITRQLMSNILARMSNSSIGNYSYELVKLVHGAGESVSRIMGPFQEEFDCNKVVKT